MVLLLPFPAQPVAQADVPPARRLASTLSARGLLVPARFTPPKANLFPQQSSRKRLVASKYTCSCGQVVRTNLYEGHGLRLLVPEELTDPNTSETEGSREEYVDTIVAKSKVVAECPSCGTVAFIDSAYGIRLYAPVAQ